MEEQQAAHKRLYERIAEPIKSCIAFPTRVQSVLRQPDPQNAGYVFILVTGTGIAVSGALLPAHLSWWWIDKAGHFTGGLTLMLGLWILVNSRYAFVSTLILSIVWEIIEWTVGSPFLVTPLDTKLDLLASCLGALLGFLSTRISRST